MRSTIALLVQLLFCHPTHEVNNVYYKRYERTNNRYSPSSTERGTCRRGSSKSMCYEMRNDLA